MAKLIQRGAEAEIYRTTWKNRAAIVKLRVPKPYRLPALDQALRRQRTKQEALLMAEARKQGTPTPIIYDVDMTAMAITMQCIDGQRIKDCIDDLSENEQRRICVLIGESIAALHKQEIVHGDLTTSNLIMAQNRVYFIDFGLGEKSSDIEKRGVDLHLLMEAFTAAHAEGRLFAWVMAAYVQRVPWGPAVKKKVAEIAGRGRYVER